MKYLLLLPLLLPLLGGALPFFFPRMGRKAFHGVIFGTVLLGSAAIAALLFLSPPSLTLFSLLPGAELLLSLDGLGKVFAGLIAALWPFATLYAFSYLESDPHEHLFFFFYTLSYGVTAGICFAGNLLTLYVFYELLTLTTIPLVLHGFTAEHRHAARKYAAYSIGGAALALTGIVWLLGRGYTGAFTYGGIVSGSQSAGTQVVFLLLFFGFGVKAAVFPSSGWLPTASVAPTPVTALLHAVAVVKAGVFAIFRVCYFVFDPALLLGSIAQKIALSFAAFTVVFGAAMALKERHFKRRLAWSTVSNLSYILCGALLLTPAGFAAGLLHMLFHAMMKLSSFFCAGAFQHVTGEQYLYRLYGVGKRMPVVFGSFTVCSLSLMGVPLFSGFISKYKLILAAVTDGSVFGWIVTGALLAAALLCAIYMLSVAIRAFFPLPEKDLFAARTDVRDPDWRMLLPIVLFAGLCLVFGMFPGAPIKFAEAVASGAL